jgi:SAM-dependent methyltransferase
METKSFNKLDEFIASWRLSKVKKYVSEGDRVLDFGCGYQAYLLRSIKHIISEGIGIDTSIEKSTIGENIILIHQDVGKELPFENEYFDKIFLLAVYEHIPLEQTVNLLKEFKRILKPGGKLTMTIPTPNGKPVLEFMAFKLKIISEVQIADHVKYYTKEDVEQDAEKAGLELIHHEYFQFGWNSLQVLQKSTT